MGVLVVALAAGRALYAIAKAMERKYARPNSSTRTIVLVRVLALVRALVLRHRAPEDRSRRCGIFEMDL